MTRQDLIVRRLAAIETKIATVEGSPLVSMPTSDAAWLCRQLREALHKVGTLKAIAEHRAE